MKQEFEPGTCIYCGKTGQVTDDHVPPKNLFSKPLPNNLITVPACDPCNKSFSMDDEYFRLKMALNTEVYGHPDVDANLPAIYRSLQRPKAKGMAKAFFADMDQFEIRTRSGLFVENRTGFHVDLSRLDRVVARTVRGLFYKETGTRIPDEYGIRVLCNEYLEQEPPSVVEHFTQTLFIPMLKLPVREFGKRTFSYRFAQTERPPCSCFSLTYYAKIPYFAMVIPRSECQPGEQVL